MAKKVKIFKLSALDKLRKKAIRRTGGRITSYSLWVYHTPGQEQVLTIWPILERSGGEWVGDGCCTDGLADVSWSYNRFEQVRQAMQALKGIPEVKRMYVIAQPHDVEVDPETGRLLN